MTSQIILGNFAGIVAASDSAMTMTNTGAVSHGHHKIFELGAPHRVVVTIASALYQDGMPQSATLRQWAETLGEPLTNLQDYALSFRAFYETGRAPSAPSASNANIRSMLSDHYSFLMHRIQRSGVFYEDPELLDGLNEFEIENISMTVITEGLEYLRTLPNYEGFSDDESQKILSELEIDVDRAINQYFSEFPLTEAMWAVLRESAPLVISRAQYMQNIGTQLYFIGYGSEDSAPVVVDVSNRGTIGNHPLHYMGTPNKVGPGSDEFPQLLYTVAQDSAIATFVQGIDQDFPNQIRSSLESQYASSSDNPDERWGGILDAVRSVKYERYTRNFLELIANAPLERLAEIARTMIEIQKIRSESEPGVNSVGGDVDVVLIPSRGDTVWVSGRSAS